MVRCGVYFFCNKFLQGCSIFLEISFATTKSLNSSSISSIPLIIFSLNLALLWLPRSIMEFRSRGGTMRLLWWLIQVPWYLLSSIFTPHESWQRNSSRHGLQVYQLWVENQCWVLLCTFMEPLQIGIVEQTPIQWNKNNVNHHSTKISSLTETKRRKRQIISPLFQFFSVLLSSFLLWLKENVSFFLHRMTL